MINNKNKIKRIVSILLSVFFIFLTISSCTRTLKRRRFKKRKINTYHVVKKGETLWRISKNYKVDLKIISKANDINDPTSIYEGQKLLIPRRRKTKRIAKRRKAKPKKAKIKKISFSPLRTLNFLWPINGQFTSSFGMRKKRKHDGIDIAAPKGTNIKAAESGKIIFSGWGPTGYGKLIIIKHTASIISVYAHNSKLLVKKDQLVKKGQKIAKVGSTGRSTGPHLHFEVRKNKIPVDPLLYLP